MLRCWSLVRRNIHNDLPYAYKWVSGVCRFSLWFHSVSPSPLRLPKMRINKAHNTILSYNAHKCIRNGKVSNKAQWKRENRIVTLFLLLLKCEMHKPNDAKTKRRHGQKGSKNMVETCERVEKSREKRNREHTESHRNDNITYYFVCWAL